MREINMLILNVGRRVELVKCFKSAKEDLGIKGMVIATDMSKYAPALYFADKGIIVPPISDKEYIPKIISICNEFSVDWIIPIMEQDVDLLSEQRNYIEQQTSTKVMLSSKSVIDITRNKMSMYKFLKENKLGTPKIILEEDILKKNYSFPLFIKPFDGVSSISSFKVNNERELSFFKEYVPNPLIQELIDGDEYCVDVFADFQGNPITIVPRRKLSVRSGETARAQILKDREVIIAVEQLIKLLKPVGALNIDCFKTDEGIKFIDINARFASSALMSIKVGANSIKDLYRLVIGDELTYNEDYQDNIVCATFDQEFYINNNGN